MSTQLAAAAPSYYRDDFARGADGTSIYYRIEGAGDPALVLCDGVGCAGYAWKYIVRSAVERHRVVQWHYRGHGRSAAPGDLARLTFDDVLGDLSAVLDGAGLKRAVLVGFSMGVQVILEYHRRNPGRVQGLVAMCGAYGEPLDTFGNGRQMKRLLPVINWLVDSYPRYLRPVWRTLLGGELAYQVGRRAEAHADLIEREDFLPYFEHMGSMDPRIFWGMVKHLARHSAADHLPSVNVPALIIAAEHDGFTPLRLQQEMHARIPGSELCVIPGGTHTSPIEMPDLITLRLEKWLKQHFAR